MFVLILLIPYPFCGLYAQAVYYRIVVYLRIMYAIRSYYGFLSPILEELLDALKKKDTILVGDLSEYELAPKIEELSAVLSAL